MIKDDKMLAIASQIAAGRMRRAAPAERTEPRRKMCPALNTNGSGRTVCVGRMRRSTGDALNSDTEAGGRPQWNGYVSSVGGRVNF
jgi:hypothetical protein